MSRGPERFTRNPSQVEAMCLDHAGSLNVAATWLRGHNLQVALSHPTLIERALMVPGPAGFIARVGQWIVHDLTAGTWSAVDDKLIQSPLYTPQLADVLPMAARR